MASAGSCTTAVPPRSLIAHRPPADAPITTMSFVAMGGAMQATRLRPSGLELFHEEDHALALLRRRDQRRAGDAALDLLAAPVHRVEHDLLVLAVAREAGP